MSKNKIIVLSDIHIGTNVSTVWYQKDIHEPYLVTILDWIVENANSIQELILLGDVVDFWTYPPEEEPPGFDKIIKANPALFDEDGKLSRVLTALDGKVTYVHGNHDMSITQADLDKIKNSQGYKIRLHSEDIYYPKSNGSKEIACTHGHIYTMFNAPYLPEPNVNNPIAPLPLGQLITRSVAFERSKELANGQNVAQLKDSGDPDSKKLLSSALPDLEKAIIPLLRGENPHLSIPEIILNTISRATGMSETQVIKLPGGKKTTLEEGKKIYANLWSQWQKKEGTSNAIKSILADTALDDGFLGGFAQKLAQDVGAKLVVMGHTHKPISGIVGSPTGYVNTGFNCPSTVDLANNSKNATFVEIDIEACQAKVLKVVEENSFYNIKPCPAQSVESKTEIKIGEYKIKLDFDPNKALDQIIKIATSDAKFIIEVANKTKYELQCVGVKNDSGTWTLQNIPANTSIQEPVNCNMNINTFSLAANYRVENGSGFVQLAASWPAAGQRKINVGNIDQDGSTPAEEVWSKMEDPSDKSCSNNSVEVRAFIQAKEKGKTIIWFYEVTQK